MSAFWLIVARAVPVRLASYAAKPWRSFAWQFLRHGDNLLQHCGLRRSQISTGQTSILDIVEVAQYHPWWHGPSRYDSDYLDPSKEALQEIRSDSIAKAQSNPPSPWGASPWPLRNFMRVHSEDDSWISTTFLLVWVNRSSFGMSNQTD